jgi:hypothetical protein
MLAGVLIAVFLLSFSSSGFLDYLYDSSCYFSQKYSLTGMRVIRHGHRP